MIWDLTEGRQVTFAEAAAYFELPLAERMRMRDDEAAA